MTAANTPVAAACGPTDWIAAARAAVADGDRAVLAMIVRHAGSTPREAGAWMLLGPGGSDLGTLGGGEMEHVAGNRARDMLEGATEWRRTIVDYLLGPDLGQCCGGGVEILLEPLDREAAGWLASASAAAAGEVGDAGGHVLFAIRDPRIPPRVVDGGTAPPAGDGVHLQPLADPRPRLVVFGAGHVGRAVAAIAAQLPLRVEVVDGRPEAIAAVPAAPNIVVLQTDDPAVRAATLAAGAAALVMTHSHAVDYGICRVLLGRGDLAGDLAYVGLIGSRSKGARFRQRLAREGLESRRIAGLTSPIGGSGPAGKEPGVIALAVLAEILMVFRAAAAAALGEAPLAERKTGDGDVRLR